MTTPRATTWPLRTRSLDLSQRPLIMGILNVTPDSFSDGGRYDRVDLAVERAIEMQATGADIIDVGGESTRPYSDPLDALEELRRIEPVLTRLANAVSLPISIDTSKASVARVALELGAEIVNDVTGLEADPGMLELVVQRQPGVCVMHMLGNPQTMQDNPQYDDVVGEILAYLKQRRDRLVEAGVELDRICLDPGLGFGKQHRHNLDLLHSAARFHELGCPLLVGHSRKGFIAKEMRDRDGDRTAGTLGVSLALARSGVQVLRVHDVAATFDGLKLFRVAGGLSDSPFSGAVEDHCR